MPVKENHISDDEPVAKMGYPDLDMGHPSVTAIVLAAAYGRRDAVTLLASGNASVSAIAAQFVAALDIHWSCS